ncbi:MAG: VCBS repeat-containing protein [Phycisphaerales bacterium]|nr:VCBS repeat-containing protein [Phycisphaerales bacterium]
MSKILHRGWGPRRFIACTPLCVALGLCVEAPGQTQTPSPGRTLENALWTVELKAPSFGSAAAADLNGDGKPDVVFGTYFNDAHVYAISGGDGSILWKFKSEGGPFDASILLYDVNRDGQVEVVFADSSTGTLFCLNGKGEVLWKFKGQSSTDSPPAAADINGGGDIEIVYGTMKSDAKSGHVNCLKGATGERVWSVPVPGHIQSEPALVDLDGDGDLDVLVTNWMGDNKLRALSGKDGKELWAFDTADWVYHGTSVGDFDADQKPEVVVADRKGHVWMLKGSSGEAIWQAALEGERDGSVFAPMTLVDVDGDAVFEIAVCGQALHLLDAKGKVRWRNAYGFQSIARGASVADVDSDGKPELVFGEGTRIRAVHADTGTEVFAFDLRIGDDPFEGIDHAPLLLDLNGDGKLDVFAVCGRGISDPDEAKGMKRNYGRAVAFPTPKGKAGKDNAWLTFRGGARRTGARE